MIPEGHWLLFKLIIPISVDGCANASTVIYPRYRIILTFMNESKQLITLITIGKTLLHILFFIHRFRRCELMSTNLKFKWLSVSIYPPYSQFLVTLRYSHARWSRLRFITTMLFSIITINRYCASNCTSSCDALATEVMLTRILRV